MTINRGLTKAIIKGEGVQVCGKNKVGKAIYMNVKRCHCVV